MLRALAALVVLAHCAVGFTHSFNHPQAPSPAGASVFHSPRVARALGQVSDGISAAALSDSTVIAASFGGDATIVVAMPVSVAPGAPCEHELVAWDTSKSTEAPRSYALPQGLCVAALAWYAPTARVVVISADTGHAASFDPATWSLDTSSNVPPGNGNAAAGWPQPTYSDHDVGFQCKLSGAAQVALVTGTSGSLPMYAAWGPTCLAQVQHDSAPLVSSAWYPGAAPNTVLFDVAVAGNTGGALDDQTLYIGAFLQCSTCGAGLPIQCPACTHYHSHSALLVVSAKTLTVLQEVDVDDAGEVTVVTIGGQSVVLTSAGYPTASLQLRSAAAIDTLASTLTLAQVSATMPQPFSTHDIQAVTSSLEVVPFAAEGTLLWTIAYRNTTSGYSFNTVLLVLVQVTASGTSFEATVQDVRVVDMVKLAKEFGDTVAQELLAVPLDAPGVYATFDTANKQAMMALTLGSADARLFVSAGLAVAIANGKLTPESPPVAPKPSGPLFYKRKFPLLATLALVAVAVCAASLSVYMYVMYRHGRRRGGTQSREHYAELGEPQPSFMLRSVDARADSTVSLGVDALPATGSESPVGGASAQLVSPHAGDMGSVAASAAASDGRL